MVSRTSSGLEQADNAITTSSDTVYFLTVLSSVRTVALYISNRLTLFAKLQSSQFGDTCSPQTRVIVTGIQIAVGERYV